MITQDMKTVPKLCIDEDETKLKNWYRDNNTGLWVEIGFREVAPRISRTEYARLKNSISDMGQLTPILVDEYKTILDGHYRLRACNELGITPKFETKNIDHVNDNPRLVIFDSNLALRQMNDWQKCELILNCKFDLAYKHTKGYPELLGKFLEN